MISLALLVAAALLHFPAFRHGVGAFLALAFTCFALYRPGPQAVSGLGDLYQAGVWGGKPRS